MATVAAQSVAGPPPTDAPTVVVAVAGGNTCHLSTEFAAASTMLSVMLEDAATADVVLPLTAVGAEELSHLAHAFSVEAEQGGGAVTQQVWAQLTPAQLAACVRCAGFLGLGVLRRSAVRQLAQRLHGLDVPAMRGQTGAAPGDALTPAQQELVVAMLNEPSAERFTAVQRALSEGGEGGAEAGAARHDDEGARGPLGLDWDSALELLSSLDLSDLSTFLTSSRSSCELLFSPRLVDGACFRAWAVTVQSRHPALSQSTAASSTVGQSEVGQGPEEMAARWADQLVQMLEMWRVLQWLERQDPESDAWLLGWLRAQVGRIADVGSARPQVPVSLLSNCVYLLCRRKPPHNRAMDCYTMVIGGVGAATTASSKRICASEAKNLLTELQPESPSLPNLEREPPRGSASQLAPSLTATLDSEWKKLMAAHADLRLAFGYLERHFVIREGVTSLEVACRESCEQCVEWSAVRRRGWSPEVEPPPPELQPHDTVLLIFDSRTTMRATVRQLADCETLLAQVRAAQRLRAGTFASQVDEPFALVTGCTKVSMMKLIEFNEVYDVDGVSEEDKLALVDTFKKSMERQDQLPLLFQTITAANQTGHRRLTDELCKFIAEMISQRTPNEILDFFNIKKDATREEEQELIATHSVSVAPL